VPANPITLAEHVMNSWTSFYYKSPYIAMLCIPGPYYVTAQVHPANALVVLPPTRNPPTTHLAYHLHSPRLQLTFRTFRRRLHFRRRNRLPMTDQGHRLHSHMNVLNKLLSMYQFTSISIYDQAFLCKYTVSDLLEIEVNIETFIESTVLRNKFL